MPVAIIILIPPNSELKPFCFKKNSASSIFVSNRKQTLVNTKKKKNVITEKLVGSWRGGSAD